MKSIQIALVVTLLSVLLNGCLGMPDKVRPVQDFDVQKYLGTWYEIARLDHSFERGLEQVSATYSVRDDGGIRVINQGYSTESQTWESAEGRAYFVENPSTGYLKVSFFGPFFGSYVVFELDADYQHAFVAGNTTDYLWFLARTPTVSQQQIDQFEASARAAGFPVEQLIYVPHTP